MNKEELRKVQLIQLEMTKEVQRICKKHGLRFYLISGTLLGAIRHKGFIPWDDDVDIAMLREDYVKFLELAKTEMDEQYFVQTWYGEDDYPLCISKMRKKNTSYVEGIFEHANFHKGIFIDIFVYDNYPENIMFPKLLAAKIHMLKAMIKVKCHRDQWEIPNHYGILKKLKHAFYQLLGAPYTKAEIVAMHDRIVTRYNNTCTGKKVVCGVVPYGDSVHPTKLFEEIVEVPFEDTTFPCFKEYDYFLKENYGDYMTPPPEHKRYSNGHNIKDLCFDVAAREKERGNS